MEHFSGFQTAWMLKTPGFVIPDLIGDSVFGLFALGFLLL